MTEGGPLHLLVPGPLGQRTGGYIYDARMVDGLRSLGWRVVVHSLEGRFPYPDEAARSSLGRKLAELPEGSIVLVDGLAVPTLARLPEPSRAHLQVILLIHHLTYQETGINSLIKDDLQSLEKRALARATGVVATSAYTAGEVERLDLAGAPVRVVEPGVESATRARGPGPGSPPRLLCVGSVTPRKGQDVLMRALARLRNRVWSCVCAGSLDRDRDFAAEVLRLADEFRLTERVEFAGVCDEARLHELYDESSLFVLASHFEGYGMALAEALVRGLPVVSTTGGAIPYTVPKEAGILVPPGDPEALAQALDSLLREEPIPDDAHADPVSGRRSELAAAAWRHGATLPSWDHQARVFAEAISSIAGEELYPRGAMTEE